MGPLHTFQARRNLQMKQAIAICLMIFTLLSLSVAEETTFRGVKVVDARNKQADANLIFNDTDKKLVVRVADRDFMTIPYDQLDKASYEYTKKHRITAGALVMIASLGAGAVVMLTSSKSHWLYVDYREQNVPKTLVLRMDKKDYKDIMAAYPAHTGKEVENLGKAQKKSKKDKNKEQQQTKASQPAASTTS
jgi:hypothetical protein